MPRQGTTRRRFLQATGGTFTGGKHLYGFDQLDSEQPDESWSQFRYDNANTGHAPNNTGPLADVTKQWSIQTGGAIWWSSPAVVGDTIYIGNGGHMHALNTNNGKEQWIFQTGKCTYSSPTIFADTVYIGSEDDKLYGLDSNDGSKQWTFQTTSPKSPSVVDDTVYIGSSDNKMYALNASDGSKQWSFEMKSNVWTPAIVNNTIYVGSSGNKMYALSASDGSELWSYETGSAVTVAPAVINDTVYFANHDGTVYALNATDGTKQWMFETNSAVKSSPAVAHEIIYFGNDGGKVYALNATDGTKQWVFETNSAVKSSPAVVDKTVYLGNQDGTLYALDAMDSTKRWSVKLANSIYSSPAVLNGDLYIGSIDGRVYAFTGKTSLPSQTSTLTSTPSSLSRVSSQTPTLTSTPSSGIETSTSTLNESSLSVNSSSQIPSIDFPGVKETIGIIAGMITLFVTAIVMINLESGNYSRNEQDLGDQIEDEKVELDNSASDSNQEYSTNKELKSQSTETGDQLLADIEYIDQSTLETVSMDGPIEIYVGQLIDEEEKAQLFALSSEYAKDDSVTKVCNRIAERWSSIAHNPHIATVYGWNEEPRPWIVFDPNISLNGMLGDLDSDDYQQIIAGIFEALQTARLYNISHTSISPTSIHLRKNDEIECVTLSDWGLTPEIYQVTNHSYVTQYTAPEQLDTNDRTADRYTDIYRTGAIIYRLFVGQPPFVLEDNLTEAIEKGRVKPPTEMANVSSNLDDVIETAMALNPTNRYDSLSDFEQALSPIFD